MSVGRYSRRLSSEGALLTPMIMFIMVLIAAVVGVLSFKGTFSQTTSEELTEDDKFDTQFRGDHVHWRSPVASLGGSPKKPLPVPQLRMPQDYQRHSQGYPSYQSSGSLQDRTSATPYSRPSTGFAYLGSSNSDLSNIIGSHHTAGPKARGFSGLPGLPKDVQYHDISTARLDMSQVSSPYAFSPRRDLQPSVSSLHSLPRISVEPPRQAPSVSSGALPRGDWLPSTEIMKKEVDDSLVQEAAVGKEADSAAGIPGSIPGELEALLDERRRVSDHHYVRGQRPVTRTPREIVRDVNLRRSEAEEEMLARIRRDVE